MNLLRTLRAIFLQFARLKWRWVYIQSWCWDPFSWLKQKTAGKSLRKLFETENSRKEFAQTVCANCLYLGGCFMVVILEPPNCPETPENFKDTQSDKTVIFGVFPQSDSKVTRKPTFWPHMWPKRHFWPMGSLLSHFGRKPRKSLSSHFWVSLKFSGLGGPS